MNINHVIQAVEHLNEAIIATFEEKHRDYLIVTRDMLVTWLQKRGVIVGVPEEAS